MIALYSSGTESNAFWTTWQPKGSMLKARVFPRIALAIEITCSGVPCCIFISLKAALTSSLETYFEAALNQKVAKTVDHQWVGLSNDGLDDIELLLDCAYLQFLLQKDRSLLIVVANNLVHDVTPITVD